MLQTLQLFLPKRGQEALVILKYETRDQKSYVQNQIYLWSKFWIREKTGVGVGDWVEDEILVYQFK